MAEAKKQEVAVSEEKKEVAHSNNKVTDYSLGIFGTSDNFIMAMQMAKALSSSTIVPSTFQKNDANCLIAIEQAQRLKVSPLMVMQNLYVIKRKTARKMEVKKMDFLGSYDISVDTKKDMQEITGNICGKAHQRFRDECILAQNNGIKLYVLVENTDGIKTVQDVFKWHNPRLHRYNKIAYMHKYGKWLNVPLPKAEPTSGTILAKAMLTMQLKYGVEFVFCRPEDAGAKVLELLGANEDG